MYTKEWNVKWEQLSPDVQEIISGIQSEINTTARSIMHNSNLITLTESALDEFYIHYKKRQDELQSAIITREAQKKIKTISKLNLDWETEKALEAVTPSPNNFSGQIAKVNVNNVKKITTSDYVIPCRVVSTISEKTSEFNNPPKLLKEIYDDWIKFAHYDQDVISSIDSNDNTIEGKGQAISGYQKGKYRRGIIRLNESLIEAGENALNGWSYTDSSDTLECIFESEFTSGFVNPEVIGPNEYIFEVKIDTDGDNDNVGILVGYMKEDWTEVESYYHSIPNPVEHTLSFVRSKNNKQTFMLVYDLGWTTQQVLMTYSISANTNSNQNIVYIKIIKRYDTFYIYTSGFTSSSTPTYTYNFIYTMPYFNPNDWSAQMFENLRIMILHSSRVGLITRSNKAKFNILQQKYITNTSDYIYSLYENKVYEYKPASSSWTQLGSIDDFIEPRVFLFNPRTNHIFFYYINGVYRQLG